MAVNPPARTRASAPLDAAPPPRRAEVANTPGRLVEAIVAKIRNGSYPPGSRLVEAALTQEFKVSRGPLREALRRLEADGFIELLPNRGATVRRIDHRSLAQAFLIREVLEGLAASLAARRIDENGHRGLVNAAIDAIHAVRQGTAPIDFLDDNIAFHELVLDLAGNPELRRMVHRLHFPAFRAAYFDLIGSVERDEAQAEHLAILKAIGAGDAVLAERRMRAHVQHAARLFLQLPEPAYREASDRRAKRR